jgi:hypothetical protein
VVRDLTLVTVVYVIVDYSQYGTNTNLGNMQEKICSMFLYQGVFKNADAKS